MTDARRYAVWPEPKSRSLKGSRPFFQNKPNQIPPLGIRVSSDLHAVGFTKKPVAQSTTIATPPWLLSRPVVDLRLHCSHKDTTMILLPIFSRTVFMNYVTSTRISIASTQMATE